MAGWISDELGLGFISQATSRMNIVCCGPLQIMVTGHDFIMLIAWWNPEVRLRKINTDLVYFFV